MTEYYLNYSFGKADKPLAPKPATVEFLKKFARLNLEQMISVANSKGIALN